MLIVGCDYHPKWQQVAWFDTETGEIGEQKLVNGDGEAERWYGQLPVPSLIGLEATGNSQWFLDRLNQLGHEVWVGDAAEIRASYVRRQKNDRRDAGHVLKLLREGRFPRLWVPSAEQRDLRQLLIHRHKLVQIRSRVKNGLQHLAMNQGMQKKSRLLTRKGVLPSKINQKIPRTGRMKLGSLGGPPLVARLWRQGKPNSCALRHRQAFPAYTRLRLRVVVPAFSQPASDAWARGAASGDPQLNKYQAGRSSMKRALRPGPGGPGAGFFALEHNLKLETQTKTLEK
jgi:hypothetical protein